MEQCKVFSMSRLDRNVSIVNSIEMSPFLAVDREEHRSGRVRATSQVRGRGGKGAEGLFRVFSNSRMSLKETGKAIRRWLLSECL